MSIFQDNGVFSRSVSVDFVPTTQQYHIKFTSTDADSRDQTEVVNNLEMFLTWDQLGVLVGKLDRAFDEGSLK